MSKNLKSHSGYLIIDHRDSPGIKLDDVPARLQKSTIIVNAGKVYEADTKNCTHCQRGVVLNPDRERARGYCPYCHHYICDSCRTMLDITGKCVPFVSLLDKIVI